MIAQPDVFLKKDIARAVNLMALEKGRDGVKSLSRYNPKKAGKILYLFSQGASQSTMSRHYGLHHDAVKNTIKEYANHTTRWRQQEREWQSLRGLKQWQKFLFNMFPDFSQRQSFFCFRFNYVDAI